MITSIVSGVCPLCEREHPLECGCMVPRIPVVRTVPGDVEGLPDPIPGTVFLVSRIVKAAVPDRMDCMVPDDLVRDSEGRVIGCRRLSL